MKEQVIEKIHVKDFKGQRMYIQDVCNEDKKGIGLGNPFANHEKGKDRKEIIERATL